MSLPLIIALAIGGPVTVKWTAPPGCPGIDTVIAEARGLGADLDDPSLELEGEIAEVEGGYELAVTIRTASGTTSRRVHGESCEGLARAAALMLAVAVDPMRVPMQVPVPPPPSDPVATPESSPAATLDGAPSKTTASPSPAPAATPAVQGTAIVSGTLGRGISPKLDARMQIGLALTSRWVRAELLGFHAFAQVAEYSDLPGLGASIRGWGGSLRAGPRFAVRWLEIACPVGVQIAAVIAEGRGALRTWRRPDLAWGLLAAPGLRVPLGQWVAVGADVEVDVAVRRPAFRIEGLGDVYRMPRVGVRGGARLEVRFFGPPGDRSRSRRRRT